MSPTTKKSQAATASNHAVIQAPCGMDGSAPPTNLLSEDCHGPMYFQNDVPCAWLKNSATAFILFRGSSANMTLCGWDPEAHCCTEYPDLVGNGAGFLSVAQHTRTCQLRGICALSPEKIPCLYCGKTHSRCASDVFAASAAALIAASYW